MLRALLHDHERAKKYYKRAMQLATSLAPRSFHFEDWWQDCSSALLAYQQEALRQEEEARQAEREPILKVRHIQQPAAGWFGSIVCHSQSCSPWHAMQHATYSAAVHAPAYPAVLARRWHEALDLVHDVFCRSLHPSWRH